MVSSSVWIQKFPLSIKCCCRISSGFFVLASFSIMMNFLCLLKLWLFSWRCFDANIVLGWGFFTSFLWLFSLILKRVSTFSRFCWLLKVNVVMTWLQHRVLLFPKDEKHFPGFKVLLLILFTILFSILLLPISSLRFLLHLKAITGSFWKTLFRDSLIDSMLQFFRIISLMFDKN